MRRLLLLTLLITAAFAAVDASTGCTKFTDHVICPTDTNVTATIKYTSQVECFFLQNEYDRLEEIGCWADVPLTQTLEYQACSTYIPFNISGIKFDEMDENYACSTERLAAGDNVTIFAFKDQFTDCQKTEGDEYYEIWSCPAEGTYDIDGLIGYDNGTYSLSILAQKKQGFDGMEYATPLMLLAVAVLGIYAAYVWSSKPKKRR